MLRRILAIIALTLLPEGVALALPAAPPQTGTYNIQAALLDSIAKSGTQTANTHQGLLGYTMVLHDLKYSYSQPICKDAFLVELDNQTTDPESYQVNDTLVVTVRPNDLAPTKACISRVVRQQITSGASSGECLQGFQVGHSVDGDPSPFITKTEYNFHIFGHVRPTLQCDGKAYGANPITTVVAVRTPFIVTVSRQADGGLKELKRWSLTTDTAGQALFAYTFDAPSDNYTFKVIPGGTATAGDVISWTQKVIQPHLPSDQPVPVASSKINLTTAPLIILLVIILAGAIFLEYRAHVAKKREGESPEEEYQRIQKL